MTFKPSLRKPLAYAFKIALRRLNITLKHVDLIALPVQFEHVLFLHVHCVKQFLFLMLTNLISGAYTTVDLPGFAGQLVLERSQFSLGAPRLRMIPAEIDTALMKLSFETSNV